MPRLEKLSGKNSLLIKYIALTPFACVRAAPTARASARAVPPRAETTAAPARSCPLDKTASRPDSDPHPANRETKSCSAKSRTDSPPDTATTPSPSPRPRPREAARVVSISRSRAWHSLKSFRPNSEQKFQDWVGALCEGRTATRPRSAAVSAAHTVQTRQRRAFSAVQNPH